MEASTSQSQAAKSILIYVREFRHGGDSIVLPSRMVNTYKKLTALLHKIYKREPATHNLHIHLDDTACHGVISDVTWDEGIYLEGAETEKLELFAHFIPKGPPAPVVSRDILTFMKKGGNKATATSGPQTAPRQQINTPGHSNNVATEGIQEFTSNTTKRKLNVYKQDRTTPGKRRKANASLAKNGGNPKLISEPNLEPIQEPSLIQVSFSYVAGTAGAFKNFRTHTISLHPKDPVGLIRLIVSDSVSHSTSVSSRLRAYKSLLEYDIFVSTNRAGAVERPLDSQPSLRDHISELQTHGGIFIRTYIYLTKDGQRYARFEDAVADAIISLGTTSTAKPAATPGTAGSAAALSAPTSRSIVIGQLSKSLRKDGRKNAVIAYLSIIGARILCSVIDEDLDGNPLEVLGPARITLNSVDLLEQYAELGNEGVKTEIKRRLMRGEGTVENEGKGHKDATESASSALNGNKLRRLRRERGKVL